MSRNAAGHTSNIQTEQSSNVVNAANTAAPAKKIIQDWIITVPDDTMQVLKLLTVMGIAVTGLWEGELGEHYVAWVRPEAIALCGHLH